MWNADETKLKACRCCLSAAGTGTWKLEKLTELMRKVFYNICGLKAEPNDGHPQYVCIECSAQLRKALAIRRKTRRAHFVLKQIFMTKKVITKEDILKVNRHSSQLVSNNGLWKPQNISIIYSFLDSNSTEGIPEIVDDVDKPNTYGFHYEQQATIGDSSKENNTRKCVPRIQNNAAILVDIKPANYKELDRIAQEQRKREEEEVLRQIREEDEDNDNLDNNDTNYLNDNNNDTNDLNDDNNDTNDLNDGKNDTNDLNDNNNDIPPVIDLNDVFKDLKEPEEDSDYSLSEPEDLVHPRKSIKYNKDKCKEKKGKVKEASKENEDVQVKPKAINVYSGLLQRQVRFATNWANKPKLLNVISLAKIRHLSIDEQMNALEIRKEDIAYKSSRFRCGMCVKPFVSHSKMYDHVKMDHSVRTDIKCAICMGCFSDITDLELHQAWEHWYEYTCICGQIKYTLQDLVKCCEGKKQCSNVQLEEEKTKQQYIMKKRFDKILVQPQKWSETLSKTAKEYILCNLCGMEFNSPSRIQRHLSLEQHRIPHQTTVKYDCDVCGLSLLNLKAMEYHFDSCHSHLYKCKGCQSIFTRFDAMIHICKDSYKIPLKLKELKKKHFCVVCGATCISRSLLMKHQLSVHRMILVNSESMGNSQYLCCKTYFTNEQAYHTHLLSEGHKKAEDIPLACVQCKILFSDEAEKNEHVEHTYCTPPAIIKEPVPESLSQTQFICEFCQKICVTRVQYSRHKAQTHNDGHICDYCGKCIAKGAIAAHYKNIHKSSNSNEVELYACQFCSEKLKSAHTFVAHVLRRHTPKPYVCSICNHRTFDRYECKNHILKAHVPEKPFECTKCGLRFVSWERHDEHLKKEHQIIVTKETIKLRKKFNLYRYILCYPHMRLDGSALPIDIIDKCGLMLLDYKEETKTEVPPEKISDYFIFDNTTVLGTVPKRQMKNIIRHDHERLRMLRKNARLAKLGLSQQDLSKKKMVADDFNIKKEEEEFEVQNEIVMSYVRNEQGEFTLKFENKESNIVTVSEEKAIPDQSEKTNEQESKAVSLKYDDTFIQSPKADKRKHKAQDSERSAKQVKYKQTFVGTKTEPQTGKSLGIIDGFGDIVEGCTQNDAFLENKTQVGKNGTYIGGNKTLIDEKNVTVETLPGFSETSVLNDPSGYFDQMKTCDIGVASGANTSSQPNNESGPNIIQSLHNSHNISSGPNYRCGSNGSNNINCGPNNTTSGPNYTSVTNNIGSGPNNNSGPNINSGPNYTSGPSNITIDSGPSYTSALTENVEETRLEIDSQDLAENYEIVEVDGVQYVNIDNVLYKVEYS